MESFGREKQSRLPLVGDGIIIKRVEDELKSSYLDYAMSVIVGRALPDARDGLKPVHRRVLYSMHESGLTHDKPHKKSARVVGEVLGKYHPHGDAAVYDTIVRLAQDFAMRYPLIDGHGNFGSVDGDPAAAMRYTEIRLTEIAEEMLEDIDKETVEFVPNYDNSLKEPTFLPAKFPNLLVNGSSGIAVGMATNMAPHNLREVVDAIIAYIDNPYITVEELMRYIKGPDFPTGAIIVGKEGIVNAYKTGRGKIKLRAKARIEEQKNRERIIIEEIPYMVNKASLVESIAELVKNKKIETIADLRDESDRHGIRVVIELKHGANAELVLNYLYKHTQLETTFGIINLALVDNEPKILSLTRLIEIYVEHRKNIIKRRTEFKLRKAEERAHILEGLKIALANIDEVIKIIRSSRTVDEAKEKLINTFSLTEAQARAILEMRLQKLTSLEREKLDKELEELRKAIAEYKLILESPRRVLGIIKSELKELKKKYGDDRRTEIVEKISEIREEDLVPDEKVVITITNSGYIKRMLLDAYKRQRRGGKGVVGVNIGEDDFVGDMFVARNHDYMLFFTDRGKVYWSKVYKIPVVSKIARGKTVSSLINLDEGEKIMAAINVRSFEDNAYLFFATKKGIVKKTPLKAYRNPRSTGIIAIKLNNGDELVGVKLISDEEDVILATKLGKAIRFNGSNVRAMGRNASGVRGIRLRDSDEVVSLSVAKNDESLLTITEKGFGKRTRVGKYRITRRGGVGVINIKITPKNGNVVDVKALKNEDEIIITTMQGKIIRVRVKDFPEKGRNTIGVRLMKLDANDIVSSVAKISGEEDE